MAVRKSCCTCCGLLLSLGAVRGARLALPAGRMRGVARARAAMLEAPPELDAAVASAMALPGVSVGAAPWLALAIVLPTLAVLSAVAADARAIGWERASSRRFLIRWRAPYAARYELPTGGSELMAQGEGNAQAFTSLQECMALGRQLERTFSTSGRSKRARGEREVTVAYDADGNPTMQEAQPEPRRPARPAAGARELSYQIYEVRGGGGDGATALVVRGSYPKQVNAQGTVVRPSAEKARGARDPLSEESLGDAWRELFEAYSTELDDEWLRFRESLMEVGGSRLQVVSPEEAEAAGGGGGGGGAEEEGLDREEGEDDGDEDRGRPVAPDAGR